jgi:pSer/pThr/pTyr-binding forkhead associated (FHA) protein
LEGIEKPFELIDLQRSLGCDYIVLESLNQMKENCNIKSFHVIQLTGDELVIGRGHESDIRINDISVSRSHAQLKYNIEDGTLLLRDLKSKFGTLILIKRPLLIKEKKIHLQIGRTYIEGWLMGMDEFENLKREKRQKQKSLHQHQSQVNQENQGNQGSNNKMDIDS